MDFGPKEYDRGRANDPLHNKQFTNVGGGYVGDKITYTVVDPAGQYHTVQYLNNQWYGMENLVSHLDDKAIKWYTIRKLQQEMLVKIEGECMGFEWIPLD